MSDENIIEKIRKFVEEECRKPTSKYGFEPYEFHFIPMRNYAVELARKLNADLEIVEISAWLHDIGSIIYGRENHHITGAKIAEEKLKEFGCLEEKIEKVKHCILCHRSSNGLKPKTIEGKIISDADGIDNFNNISGIFKAAFLYEGLTQREAQISAKQKLERKWNKLYLKESKKLIKPKYDAAMLLLK